MAVLWNFKGLRDQKSLFFAIPNFLTFAAPPLPAPRRAEGPPDLAAAGAQTARVPAIPACPKTPRLDAYPPTKVSAPASVGLPSRAKHSSTNFLFSETIFRIISGTCAGEINRSGEIGSGALFLGRPVMGLVRRVAAPAIECVVERQTSFELFEIVGIDTRKTE